KNFNVKLNLLPEEKDWIRAHPVIRIGIDPDFPPYEFLEANGESSGIATDWLQLISNRTGLQFELVDVTTWSKCIQDMRQKKLDLLPCVGKSSARAEFMLFSDPYLSFSRILVTRNERDIKGLSDLAGSKIALQDNSSHHEFMKEQGFENLQLWPRYEDALLAVSRNEADVAVGNLAVSTHYMRKMMLTNLKMSAYADTKPNDLYMGVRNDWPELVSIINRAIQSITVHEQSQIYARWMPLRKPVDPALDLTREEREWLLMHPRVSVCWDSHWPPVEFADSNGKPQGISVDYIHALSEMLGIEFDMLPSAPWQTLYARLLAHEIDMSSCLSPTEQRLEFLDFTESYLTTPTVLFGRNDMAYIRDMDELTDLKVAVVENYATDDWITREYPEIKPVRLNSVKEGLRRLQNAEIDVFVGNVIVGNYQLSQLGKHDIKIVGETPHSYNLRMAVRNDWPVFMGILRKAMAALPEEDKTSFYRKWVWLKYEHGFDYTLFWKFFLGGLVVLGTVLYWNWRLHREMQSRRKAEQALATSREKLEKSYAELKNLEGLKDDLMHMIIHDMRSPLQGVVSSLDLMRLNKDKAPQRQLIETAFSSSMVMSTMIEDLLDVSRLENKQMSLRLVSADLMAIAGKAVEVLQNQLVLRKCSVELTGTVSQALMDESVIQRIFVNLIGNAIKASDKNSVITVHISDSETRSMAEVRDVGCGIPVEMQEHVFTKFGRLEDGQSYVVPSIGLGLTFCKMAVEAHGGKIEVESSEGIGSIFRFEIPKK
ncbi:MAG: transporter substrate-binding domain-containing protein, partial [Kiritimatiellaceae bacterium]|nr:transporter substrate-binding domain-containing protein [Kiritimatiellaceae bacterium]